MGIGIKIAIEATRYGGIAAAIAAFKARVLADGGTFEAEQCMVNNIQSLANIDLN